jgi:hypothetical protein
MGLKVGFDLFEVSSWSRLGNLASLLNLTVFKLDRLFKRRSSIGGFEDPVICWIFPPKAVFIEPP